MYRLVPLTRAACNAWIAKVHRHHAPPVGDLFRVGLERDGALVGVAVAGRPLARHIQDGTTCEILRVAVLPDQPNACSTLYGALRRAGQALGYVRFVTYTLPSEGGASLRASGWQEHGQTPGGEWSSTGRRRHGEESGHPELFGRSKPKQSGPKTRRVWPPGSF